jgi:hypothetical protein
MANGWRSKHRIFHSYKRATWETTIIANTEGQWGSDREDNG